MTAPIGLLTAAQFVILPAPFDLVFEETPALATGDSTLDPANAGGKYFSEQHLPDGLSHRWRDVVAPHLSLLAYPPSKKYGPPFIRP